MPEISPPAAPPRTDHTLIDDTQGLAYGSFMAALSVVVLTHLGFVTGQTAGIALLISYATGWDWAWVFFVVNIPFYWVGWKRFGPTFVAKSLFAVTLTSVLAALLPRYLSFSDLNPLLGAIMIGAFTGSGLIALFRHGASLGGIGIVGLYIQDATGFRAGWVQLIVDAAIFAVALFLLDPVAVGWSFLGAVVANLTIAINHRRDRYIV
ncbi:YitT family protein [Paracoccus aurantiacus]|uniref:YitT family protein n=1 Tax=Paracoccus aurantiacus TaxID=2599412 RepID=A0A5C6S861_9RHOB|nr:YitT family protein [Paracoccus aurantiacus]TXB70580.1 YitT family protein [Paracoccus aurantiacus]